MKQLFSFFFILIFSFSGFSQKGKTQKGKASVKKEEQETIMEATAATETIGTIGTEESRNIDTLRIKSGKPCVIIIDVNQYSGQSATMNPEEKELIQNFGKDALQIVNVYKYSYIIFENKQTLDISSYGDSYQSFAYWGGNLKDKAQVKEGTHYATEFVSEQRGLNKESSYVINTRKSKLEVASLLKADNVTEKSKEILNAFLNNLVNPMPSDKGEDQPLSDQSLKNVKSLETYFLEKNGKKIYLKSILFNKNQQPITTKNYDRKGVEKGTTSFTYKDGLLVSISNTSRAFAVNYDDNKMIFYGSIGDANETKVFRLEQNILLRKVFDIMIDDKNQYMNSFSEEKLENNCISTYNNNVLWSVNCISKTNAFPFIHKYTSFQDGEVLQFRKSKLEKKEDKLFEKYYSTAKRENEKDIFKLFGSFQLNEQNLLSSFEFTKDEVKRIMKIDYTYFSKE